MGFQQRGQSTGEGTTVFKGSGVDLNGQEVEGLELEISQWPVGTLCPRGEPEFGFLAEKDI